MGMSDKESSGPGLICASLKENIRRVFVGKEEKIDIILAGFLSGLHVLLEDIPGVGKTTLAMTLARSSGLDFGRIQFTPDLLPGDIIGMTVYEQAKREFVFKPGAIMHQFILADEINRASERTQAALLEAMAEQSVTVDGRTYQLQQPFFVMATQNPHTFAGTFLLPESQCDRFGLSLSLGYPTQSDESLILRRFKEKNPLQGLHPVTDAERIQRARHEVRTVIVGELVEKYIIEIVHATRSSPLLKLGVSPRGTQQLYLASQTRAALDGRDFVIPEDVASIVPHVFAHRVQLSGELKLKNTPAEKVVREIVGRIPIPAGV